MELFLSLTISALGLWGVYALVAFGIQLVFGLTGIVNFAHGALMTVAAYLLYSTLTVTDQNWLLAGLLVVLAMGMIGYTVERGVFRFTLTRPVTGFIVSLGLIVAIENAIPLIWSPFPIVLQPPLADVNWHPLGALLTAQQAIAVVAATATLIVLFGVVKYTRYGRALRACAEDREMASMLGAPVSAIISGAFVVGTAAAGVAGVLLAMQSPLSPSLGSTLVIKGFAVALIGGLGSLPGAVVGAAILAATEAYATGYLGSQWSELWPFVLMLVVIIVRPTGLMRSFAGEQV